MNQAAMQIVKGSRSVISRFSFKSSRRGAAIYGLAAGLMVCLQGLAYAASYTTEMARSKFATSLASNPSLGMLYGEARHIELPAGYMVYRTLPFMALIGSIWALSVSTRLLRGQEEDGRLELLLTGRDSLQTAVRKIVRGLLLSFAVTYIICGLILVALGKSSKINVSLSASLFFALAMTLPALLFMAVGTLTSQVASSRRQAMSYGVYALVVLFVIRSLANVEHSLYWLKWITPFGWADKAHAVTGSSYGWLIALFITAMLLFLLSFYLIYKRDLNDSFIAEKQVAKPRLKLLSGPAGLTFRLSRLTLMGWLVGTIFVSGLITGIAKTASSAISDSPTLTKSIDSFTGSHSAITIAFVSFAGFFVALMLMVVAATSLGRTREDEAKGLIDNFVVAKTSRLRWLLSKTFVTLMAITVICFLANSVCLLIARGQQISFPAPQLLLGGFNYLGPALALIGVGTLVFGVKPRLASYSLYAWITWSFIVEMIGSVVTLNHYILQTSLLRHVSLVPAANVDWNVFINLTLIGLVTFLMGLLCFTRRDLVNE